MNLSKKLLMILILTIFAMPAQTDIFTPSHSCSKPYKPYQFDDEWELQRFKDDVESFRSCIEEFVDEQNNAIRNHRNAADEAIDEWDNFVNYEL
jgi:hypothetical protein